jgi:hypothetical protein
LALGTFRKREQGRPLHIRRESIADLDEPPAS